MRTFQPYFARNATLTSSVFLIPDLLHFQVYRSYIPSYCLYSTTSVNHISFLYYYSRESSYQSYRFIANIFRNLEPVHGVLRNTWRFDFIRTILSAFNKTRFFQLVNFHPSFFFLFLQNLSLFFYYHFSNNQGKYKCYLENLSDYFVDDFRKLDFRFVKVNQLSRNLEIMVQNIPDVSCSLH